MTTLTTTRGEMDEASLWKRTVTHERRTNNMPSGQSVWTEYYAVAPAEGAEPDPAELVKRDITHRKYSVAEMQAIILQEQPQS